MSDKYKCTMSFPTQKDAQAFASFMCGSGEQTMWEWDGCEKLAPSYDYKTGDITFNYFSED